MMTLLLIITNNSVNHHTTTTTAAAATTFNSNSNSNEHLGLLVVWRRASGSGTGASVERLAKGVRRLSAFGFAPRVWRTKTRYHPCTERRMATFHEHASLCESSQPRGKILGALFGKRPWLDRGTAQRTLCRHASSWHAAALRPASAKRVAPARDRHPLRRPAAFRAEPDARRTRVAMQTSAYLPCLYH